MATRIDPDDAAAAARRAAELREAERRRAEAAAAAEARAQAQSRPGGKPKNDEFSTGQTKSLRVRELASGSTPMMTTMQPAAPAATDSLSQLKNDVDAAQSALDGAGPVAPEARQGLQQNVDQAKGRYVDALNQDIATMQSQRAQRPELQGELGDDIAQDQAEIARMQAAPAPAQDAAADRIAAAYAQDGAMAAASLLRVEAQQLGDPDQVDALMRDSKRTIDSISNDLGDRIRNNKDDSDTQPVTRSTLNDLAATADLCGPAGAQTLGDSLAASLDTNARAQITRGGAYLDLNEFDARLKDLTRSGQGGRLADALGTSLQSARNPQLKTYGVQLQHDALDTVNQTRDKAKAADAALSKTEARLAQDLQMYGPTMTTEQKQKYQDAFWAVPEHTKAKADAEAADDAFAKSMAAMKGDLEQRAKNGDEDAGKALVDGAAQLAQSDAHAGDAVHLVLDLGNDQQLFDAVNKAEGGKLEQKLGEDVLAQALPRMQARALASGFPGNAPDKQTNALANNDAADFAKNLNALSRMKAAREIALDVNRLDETLELLKDDPNKFRMDELLESPGKLGLALRSVAVVSAAATLADGDATQLQQLQATLQGVKAGYELGSGVLSTFAKAADLTGDVVKFGTKFLPAVGLAVDSLQFGQDVKKLVDGGNVGDGISTLGAGICMVGDIAGIVPVVGFLPDVGINALGLVVQGIGSLVSNVISGNEQAEKLATERSQLLDAAGVSADVKQLDTEFDAQTLKRMGVLGLDREQAIGLLQGEMNAFGQGKAAPVEAFKLAMDTGAAFGLQGPQLLSFIKDFCDTAARDDAGMYRVQNVMGWLSTHTQGLAADGSTDNAAKKSLADDQQTVKAVVEQFLPPDLVQKYGLDAKSTDDINAPYFAAH
jgi:hypothetical protein